MMASRARTILARAAPALVAGSSRSMASLCPKVAVGVFPSHFNMSQNRGVSNLVKTLENEIQQEKSNYEKPTTDKFLETACWQFVEKSGDVNMQLKKEVDGKKITVDFQLVAPNFEGDEMEGDDAQEASPPSEATDFTVTVEGKDGSGMTLYCSTMGSDEFVVGNMRYFASPEEKASMTSFQGPEFEDLDDRLQKALQEMLESVGINSALCSYIDATAIDKEQREYMRWLEGVRKFFS